MPRRKLWRVGRTIWNSFGECARNIFCTSEKVDRKRGYSSESMGTKGVAGVEQRERQRLGFAHTYAEQGDFEIVALLTTVNRTYKRVAMHAVSESLLEMQAAAAGLPLVKVPIPSPCPNETYEQAMGEAMARARAEGRVARRVSAICFSRTFAPIAKSSSRRAG